MNLQRYYAVGGSIVEVRPDVEIRNGQYVRAEDIAALVEDERQRTDRLINSAWDHRREEFNHNLDLSKAMTKLVLYTRSLEKMIGCEPGKVVIEAEAVLRR